MHTPKLLSLSVVFASLALSAQSGLAFQEAAAPGMAMSQAATRFIEVLDHSNRLKVLYKYEDPERLNWHFIPRERKGLGLWDLDGAALKSAEDLVRSGLSTAGYHKVLEVRSLEEVLYLFEGGTEEERRLKRHPHKYYVTIFGTPGPKGLWGWRFEGHHLSLNFSIKDGVIVSSTPEFFGANPGLIDAGPGRSLRVLGDREDIARSILKAEPESRLSKIWISNKAPGDIRGGGIAQPIVAAAEGVRFADMTTEQQGLLKKLIAEYLTAAPTTVVRERMKMIDADGMDDIHFGWWGGSELNEPHHYVVQGKSFIIEYNNTQNEANHVHAIWRNLGGDFNTSVAQ